MCSLFCVDTPACAVSDDWAICARGLATAISLHVRSEVLHDCVGVRRTIEGSCREQACVDPVTVDQNDLKPPSSRRAVQRRWVDPIDSRPGREVGAELVSNGDPIRPRPHALSEIAHREPQEEARDRSDNQPLEQRRRVGAIGTCSDQTAQSHKQANRIQECQPQSYERAPVPPSFLAA